MRLVMFGRDTRGTVAVAYAIAMIPMVLATGAAIDYQRARVNKDSLQTALDSALLAAAAAPANQREVRAQAVYAENARRITRTGEVARFWTETSTNTYHGTVEAKVPTTVMSIAHINNVAVSAQSAVSLDDAPVCMLLTAPTGVALTMTSSSLIKMPGCKVDVASTSSPAVSLKSNSTVESKELCVAGQISASVNKNTYKSGCAPVVDDWAAKMPKMAADSSCTYDSKSYSAKTAPASLSPGNICNGMSFKSATTLTFLPGVYRVRGGSIVFNAASRITANGVTFYFEDAKSALSMTANSQMTITPPTTGPTAGITMFEPPGLPPSAMGFVSAASATTEGLFYLPSRNINMNSSSGFSARKMNVVAYTATFASASTWEVDPEPQEALRVYDRHTIVVQ